MKALPSTANFGILVLSARIEPPLRELEGSTATTATRWPTAVSFVPIASIKVDLPTPGIPVIPIRSALPVWGNSTSSSAAALWRWLGLVDSTRVMARPMALRSPAITAAARSRSPTSPLPSSPGIALDINADVTFSPV